MIRLATVEDIPHFSRIDEATDQQFIDAGHPELAGDGEYIPLEAAQRGVAESRILVGEIESEIVGWAFLTRSSGELCLGQIAVHPEAQQQGIGANLLATIIGDAERAGERTIVLSTQSDLAWNQPWYERFGFEVVPTEQWTADMVSTAVEQGNEGVDWANTRVHMRLVLPTFKAP